ncbi:MAG TPA: hypothetical protein VH877_03315 [Polyangia bacterium]|jgi:hypothetical protein|nr:hypothetical protein [Polyangia bacterium]
MSTSSPQTFNSGVAARTRTADEILRSAEYLAIYVQQGGRPEDLMKIVDLGRRAELRHQEQTQAQALGGAATETVQTQYQTMRKEYRKVMAVVPAVVKDLREANAPVDVVHGIRQVLLNESERVLLPVAGGSEPDEGKPEEGESDEPKPRRSVRSQSKEAVRAEIQKDMGLLIQLEAVHPALAERKVELQRLKDIHSLAQSLSGHLSTRTARKGAAKGTTRSLRSLVAEQRREWGTIYRLLALAGRADPRIAELLASTRKR